LPELLSDFNKGII